MKCIEMGVIQAFIDGELDISMKKEVEKHLGECEKCGGEYEALKKTDDLVFDRLSAYQLHCGEISIPSGKYPSFKKPDNAQNREPQSKTLRRTGFTFKYQKAITAACIAAVLTICVAAQPVRAFIAEALNIFRVENVRSIRISYADLEEIQWKLQEKEGDIELESFGKITMEGFDEQELTIAEAKANAAVLLPPGAKDENIKLLRTHPGVLSFTMDVQNVNEALKSFGAQKLLPDSLDGKTFTVSFAAQTQYTCREGGGLFLVDQIQPPEVGVPSDVDVKEIYDCLTELPIWPEDIRRQLQAAKDWRSTIYLPVTPEKQEVKINGADGFIGEKENGGWTLVWYAAGSLFCVSGDADKEAVMAFAESLR